VKEMKNKVKEFRKHLKLTQDELAQKLGVSRQTINAIENNKYNPTLELAIKIARFLGTPVEQLFLLDK
jgi:putative transcriptional regulator